MLLRIVVVMVGPSRRAAFIDTLPIPLRGPAAVLSAGPVTVRSAGIARGVARDVQGALVVSTVCLSAAHSINNSARRVILHMTGASRSLMVLAMALLASLVAFGNIIDYSTNFAFVHHVFLMDTTFPGNGIMYRSISDVWVHHAGYIGIISMKTATAVLCCAGWAVFACSRRVLPAMPSFMRPRSGRSSA
ncbi:DUF2165 domain-containing protein [Neisseriaceae bacterium JH1-16]|nr:DUF2165 domain-containing protein [Neisseriaceae bacterium JH1-16]